MRAEPTDSRIFRLPPWLTALLIFTLAFVSFYYGFYFSEGYRGVLGYENKDTLTFLQSYFNSDQAGSTLYWDPVYLQYTPRVPQAPISSPVTLVLILLRRANLFTTLRDLMPVYLSVLALIQIGCALAMFYFLRTSGFGFWPGVFGGLIYAYNHQTSAFGILHGYERITAVLLAPLFIAAFFRLLESAPRSPRRRFFTAATALLVGLALVGNGDIKPAAFFCIFLLIAAVFCRPFSKSNLVSLAIVFLLAAGIFAVQALPTVYSLPEQGRGEEPVEQMMDFSLSPGRLLLTHFWTGFTPRPDYPWENTAEFSMSMMPLVILGLFFLRRHRYRNIILAALVFGWLWMMGKHLPTAPLQGWLMRLTALRHPNRMAMLVYFCYAFLGALGLERLLKGGLRPVPALLLFAIPAIMLAFRLSGSGEIPLRFIVFSALSCAVLAGVGFRLFPPLWAILAALFFILERTTFSRPPEEITVTDPTAYYTFDEIYRHHPRVGAILADPGHRRWRAFFGAKEYPDLFSHNLYLNAFVDGIRPIFAYFYIDEEFRRIREIQEVIFENWSHPMWSLLNVKYFVDLEGYFALWDEEDTSRVGLDSLVRVDEHVRVNPRVEEELFVRYRRKVVEDHTFLEDLNANRPDILTTAYLDAVDPSVEFENAEELPSGESVIEVLERKPDEITARVDLPRPAVLVFSEFWFWPWRVSVNGEDRPLRRAYHILQAVELDSGDKTVRFYFNSLHPAFLVPTVVSLGLILILGIYCFIQYCHLQYQPGEEKVC